MAQFKRVPLAEVYSETAVIEERAAAARGARGAAHPARYASPMAMTTRRSCRDAGVDRVRVHFTDLLGVSRNKVVPLSLLDECVEDGINFCISAFCVDHAGEVIDGTGLGAEVDFRDAQVVPGPDTLTVVPWERSTAIAIGDVRFDGGELTASPRQLLRRAIAQLDERGLRAVAGHELEFFLLRPMPGGGYEQYAKQPGLVYTLSPSVDTEGVLREMEDAVARLGLPLIATNQEYFGSQWEINLRYDDALKAADDAHLLKLAVKEIASSYGLVATFMGKPVQELGTSGYHLHLSHCGTATERVRRPRGAGRDLGSRCAGFLGGQLEHAPRDDGDHGADDQRVQAVPRAWRSGRTTSPGATTTGRSTRASRASAARRRGSRTVRGDGTANAYLASAAALFAGIDGLDRELDPGPGVTGVAYEPRGPDDDAALARRGARRARGRIRSSSSRSGPQFVQAFLAMKRSEVAAFASAVTDWELNEYATVL